MSKNNRGFTLIELLVVIAIIGILSSVVLASLSTARQKAYDANVKSELNSLQTAALVYRDGNTNYGDTNGSCSSGVFADQEVAKLITALNGINGASPVCSAVAANDTYAVSATLPSNSTHWCVDSTGANIAGAATGGVCVAE